MKAALLLLLISPIAASASGVRQTSVAKCDDANFEIQTVMIEGFTRTPEDFEFSQRIYFWQNGNPVAEAALNQAKDGLIPLLSLRNGREMGSLQFGVDAGEANVLYVVKFGGSVLRCGLN